jgi:hypothetical protein
MESSQLTHSDGLGKFPHERMGANSYVIKPTDATKLKEFAEPVKRYWLGWKNHRLAA